MIFLNLAIWLPILAGMVLLALGRDENARAPAPLTSTARTSSRFSLVADRMFGQYSKVPPLSVTKSQRYSRISSLDPPR